MKSMMEKAVKTVVVILLLTINITTLSIPTIFAQNEGQITASSVDILNLKLKYEKEIEAKVQDILNRIVGKGNSEITGLMVELRIEQVKQSAESSNATNTEEKNIEIGDTRYLLPGVPMPVAPSTPDKPTKADSQATGSQSSRVTIPSLIDKIKVTIILDKNKVSEKLMNDVIGIISSAIETSVGGQTPEEIKNKVSISITLVPFIQDTGRLDGFLRPGVLIPTILGLLLILFLYFVLPAAVQAIADAIKEGGGRGSEISIQSKNENESQGKNEGQDGQGGGAGGYFLKEGKLVKQDEEKKAEEKFVPFLFVTKDNIKNLIYLLLEEPPEIIATILGYITPELSAEVISSLPLELQMRAALAMATVRLTSEEDIRKLDSDIKKKIDFLVGGIDSFIRILDQVDTRTRNEMLASLEEQSPRLAQRVKEFIFLFEDLSNLTDQATQVILRELTPAQLGVALRGQVIPQVMDKVMKNLSENGRAMLKEEIEFGRPVTTAEIEEERRKIEKLVERLDKENKIAVRPEGDAKKAIIIEGRLERLKIGPAGSAGSFADPQKAAEHYQKGMRAYQAGNIDLAIKEFEESLNYNPNLWQVAQLLGNCYVSRGLLQQAVSAYEKSLAVNPNNVQLRNWVNSQKTRMPEQKA
ncbi:MAG: FliG C-terminal domain-containing protein [Elusimicrobiota bacterium]